LGGCHRNINKFVAVLAIFHAFGFSYTNDLKTNVAYFDVLSDGILIGVEGGGNFWSENSVGAVAFDIFCSEIAAIGDGDIA